MSLETEIREAFERHDRDARPSSEAWAGVETKIRRSHRRRTIVAGLASAAAIASIALVAPRLASRTIEPVESDTRGWATLRNVEGNYALRHPQSWRPVTQGSTVLFRPNSVEAQRRNEIFQMTVSAVAEPFDIAGATNPDARVVNATINGRRSVRIETVDGGQHSASITIEWVASCSPPGACAAPTEQTLNVSIFASSDALWQTYDPVAERILSSIEALAGAATPPVVAAKIPVRAYALATGPDALWALVHPSDEGRPDQLRRIDPATNKVDSTDYLAFGGVGKDARALAADAEGVWVTTQDGLVHVALPFQENRGPTVTGIDDPRDVALGFGSAWVTSLDAGILRVLRISTSTGGGVEVTITSERKHAPDQEAYVAIGDGYVWLTVAHTSGEGIANLYRINPKTNRIEAELVISRGSPWHIAFGYDGIWLTDTGTTSASALRRIDPAQFPNQAAFITLPDAAPVGLRAITTGAGYVWVTSGRGYLWKIDPMTNKSVGEPTLIGDDPPVSADDVVYGSGSIWVAAGDGQIWRLTP